MYTILVSFREYVGLRHGREIGIAYEGSTDSWTNGPRENQEGVLEVFFAAVLTISIDHHDWNTNI